MSTMREALYQETLPDGRDRCTLCPHDCRFGDGMRGACGVRVNRKGRMFTLVYDRVVAHLAEPIEKKAPLPLHARL